MPNNDFINKYKKKLFICTDSFVPRWDGISRFLIDLFPDLSNYYDITVIAPNFIKETNNKKTPFNFNQYNIKVIRIPLTKRVIDGYPIPKLKFFRILKELSHADIIFTQTIGPIGLSSIISAVILGIPRINFIHSVEWDLFTKAVNGNKLKKLIIKLISEFVVFISYNLMNLIITPSDEVAELLSKHHIKKPKVVVNLGTKIDKFIPPKIKYKVKKELGFNPNSFIIGYCGRLSREKNLLVLYRAFKRLKKKYHDSIKLLIVGKGLKKLENKFKSDNGVYFVGQKDDPLKYYQAMDVFVMPSLLETTSLSVIEAMSCAVPVVSTKVGFASRYIINGKNGFLFNFYDEFGLYLILQNLYKSGEIYCETIGREGRKTVIQYANWRDTVKSILIILKSFEGEFNEKQKQYI